ncbi:MAG: HAMP domain-containing sensor histidine kinase, partial [Bacteroidota bacterium]
MINACTYKKGGPVKHRVKVSVDSYHKGVRIVISDNGVGIRLDLQEKVFDMFYRGNKDSSGTGLGLYLVKQGVRKLDGKVSLHSEEGVGTQVILYLPSLEKSEEEKVEHLSHVNSQAYH